MTRKPNPAFNQEWFKAIEDDGWSILFRNAPNGNYLGNIPREDVADYIVDLQNTKLARAKLATASITVKFDDAETVALIKLMAAEIQGCYDSLDELAVIVGGPTYPRNEELINKVKEWAASLKEV